MKVLIPHMYKTLAGSRLGQYQVRQDGARIYHMFSGGEKCLILKVSYRAHAGVACDSVEGGGQQA